MPNYSLIATRSADDAFQARVRAALVVRARVAFTAGAGGNEAAYNYARQVLRQPSQFSASSAWAIATDPLIIDVPMATPVPDADIETAMNRTWTALIGVSA